MTEIASAANLREELTERRSRIADGTVVRFTKRFANSTASYTYIALWINDRWYLSGRRDLAVALSHEEFLTELGARTIVKAEVAVDWDAIVDNSEGDV